MIGGSINCRHIVTGCLHVAKIQLTFDHKILTRKLGKKKQNYFAVFHVKGSVDKPGNFEKYIFQKSQKKFQYVHCLVNQDN